MNRLLAPLVLLAFVLLAGATRAQEIEIPEVTLSGGNLPIEVELAPADADDFRRRINQPPRLENTPETEGPSYEITTPYWQTAVRFEDDDERELTIGESALYYPNGGYVRVPLGDDYAWLVLNLRQRAILQRYIDYAIAGDINETPSSLEMLLLMLRNEDVVIETGGQRLATDTATQLFTRLVQSNPGSFLQPFVVPQETDGGFWLTVTLLEGRTVRYYYNGQTLTEALGTERYDATSVAGLMLSIAPATIPTIEEQSPAGSLLWWPLMAGGGLIAIGAAIWLRRVTTGKAHAPTLDLSPGTDRRNKEAPGK